MRLEQLGLIGNCQFSALVGDDGAVVWCCLPRFDSEPIFAALLDEQHGGCFSVSPDRPARGVQRYLENTNVLETTFRSAHGAFRVLDFAPRFRQHDRTFCPTQLIRIVEPLEGAPLIQVRCDPVLGWSRQPPVRYSGSNHVRFEGYASQLRLTTDIPLSYLSGQTIALTEPKHLVLTWGQPIEEPLLPLCNRFLGETIRHWQLWVKHCEIPPLYQQEVIRSALALKLHCFEDTGAIVASMTTSIPESPGSGRNWDYRYCWLRDAFYSLGAFRLLGQFEEREQFVHYLVNVVAGAPDLSLAPLYRVDGRSDLTEQTLSDWPGFEASPPVRIGNAAFHHTQNDIFGEMVLALTPIFLDDRFSADRTRLAYDLIERLARRAVALVGQPDAGIWEYRTEWKQQTFTTLMCWAAADRMSRIARRTGSGVESEFAAAAHRIRDSLIAEAWSEERGSFVAAFGGAELDASLLQMGSLRFLPADDPRLVRTVDTIRRELSVDGWLRRYSLDDGFGRPEVGFVLCTFWLIEALALIGRTREARKLLDGVKDSLAPLGLLAEDYDPKAMRMWGNFPQAYSHVGLIRAAFAVSPQWSELL